MGRFCGKLALENEIPRYCVGWSLSRWIDTRLTLSALEAALCSRLPEPGLIHHSDQGVQYASSEYIARLNNAGVLISMAAVGNPYENAKAESFFRTLKMEEVYIKDYRRFEEAEQNIAEFIEKVYNKKRCQLSMNAAVVIVSGLDSSASVISFNSLALAVALFFE
jgi:putative transposase